APRMSSGLRLRAEASSSSSLRRPSGPGATWLRRPEHAFRPSKVVAWRTTPGRGVACQVTRARLVEGADGSRRSRGRRGCRSRRNRPARSANVLRPPDAGGGLLPGFAAQARRPLRHVAQEEGTRCSAVSLFRCRRRWPVGRDQANAAAYPEETIAFCTASVTLTLPAISWRPLPMATCIGPVGAPL